MSELPAKAPRCQGCKRAAEVIITALDDYGRPVGFYRCQECAPQFREEMIATDWKDVRTEVLGTKP